eukprot:6472689-Amphidinium_carterae.1
MAKPARLPSASSGLCLTGRSCTSWRACLPSLQASDVSSRNCETCLQFQDVGWTMSTHSWQGMPSAIVRAAVAGGLRMGLVQPFEADLSTRDLARFTTGLGYLYCKFG